MPNVAKLLQELSEEYLALHRAKEDAFWETRMGLSDRGQDLAAAELELKTFLGDETRLAELRSTREGLAERDPAVPTLAGWIELLSRNQVPDDRAKELLRELIERETALLHARAHLTLGYDRGQGREPAGMVEIANASLHHSNPSVRQNAFEELRAIETSMLENGFLEVVRLRNHFARRLGFEDFYDYKTQWSEGFAKRELFGYLDNLEQRTRRVARNAIDDVAEDHGAEALRPWNFGFLTAGGGVQAEIDPYFRFEDALDRWLISFAAMGIRFRGARLTLDLVARDGKYENGFMHATVPAFIRQGKWLPAEINFTSNALPGHAGSGVRAIKTLFHEGGHAAHFANVVTDAPCFSQEYAPTSVAFAETQSMFCDSVLEDISWRTTYARNGDGKALSDDLAERIAHKTYAHRAQKVRNLLVICYAEKAIYEMSDVDISAQNIVDACRETERRVTQLPEGCPRPTLMVPHLYNWTASASYHGYVLAQMAVSQTRRHFRQKFGGIVAEPRVGEELSEVYWKPGNAIPFRELVRGMTGEEFSGDALVDSLNRPWEAFLAESKLDVARVRAARQEAPSLESLDVRLRVVHGSETIVGEGAPLERAGELFRSWVRKNWPESARTQSV